LGLVLVMIVVGLFGAGYLGLIDFYRPFVVLSGSMEPEILTGSVVLVKSNQFGYMEGDVITFATSENAPPVTHRIVDLQVDKDILKYQTQGDANEEPDKGLVDPRNVIGRVGLIIPYLGYLANIASQPIGFVALVVIPATILIYEELRTMKREIIKLLSKKKDSDTSQPEPKSEPTLEPKAEPTAQIVVEKQINIPHRHKHTSVPSVLDRIRKSNSARNKLLGVGLVFLLLQGINIGTQASYNDFAITRGNIFGASTDFGGTAQGEPIALPEVCSHLQGEIFIEIRGTGGNDSLEGTSANELILGRNGNDTIDGGGGDDCIIGGQGDDKIDGGSGNDIITGGAGSDEIDGGEGNDYIAGNGSNDSLLGGSGDDEIHGGTGDDTIEGGSGKDTIRGQGGNDLINGGSGEDDIRGNSGDDTINGGSDNDLLSGGADYDILDGESGTDTCLSGEELNSCEL